MTFFFRNVLYYKIKTLNDFWCRREIESQIFYLTIRDFIAKIIGIKKN